MATFSTFRWKFPAKLELELELKLDKQHANPIPAKFQSLRERQQMTVRPVSKAFERQKMNGFASVWLGVELETPSWSRPARALLYSLTAEKQNWNRQPSAVYNYNKSRTTTENNKEQQNPQKKKIKKKPARKTQLEPNFNLNRLVLKLLRRITPSRSRSHSPRPNPIPHRPHQHRCRRSPTDSWKGGWNFVVREMEKLKTLAFLISAFFVFVSLFVAFFTHSTEIPNRSDSKTMFNVFIQVFPFVICLPRWNESEQ